MSKIIKRLTIWAIIVAAILTIPLLANWPWTGSDFVFTTVVLFGSALVYEFVSRRFSNSTYKLAVGIAVVGALLLVWINAAVGIIGDNDNGSGLIYLGILACGFLTAIIIHFEPRRMAFTLFAIATAIFFVPILALIIMESEMIKMPGAIKIFTLNSFFVVAFTVSGLLFKHSSKPHHLNS